jgi:hypothetical protein
MSNDENRISDLIEAGKLKLNECYDNLQKFGKVETICQSVYNYEFLITEGFKENARSTFKCIEECMTIAEGYPYVKSLLTKENRFHLILTKSEK